MQLMTGLLLACCCAVAKVFCYGLVAMGSLRCFDWLGCSGSLPSHFYAVVALKLLLLVHCYAVGNVLRC